MLSWQRWLEGIKAHPRVAAVLGVLATIGAGATGWSWWDDRPFLKTLWNARPALTMDYVIIVLVVGLLAVSGLILFGLAYAVVQGRDQVAALKARISILERKLDVGSFKILTRGDDFIPTQAKQPKLGEIYWRQSEPPVHGRLVSPEDLVEEYEALARKEQRWIADNRQLTDERDVARVELKNLQHQRAVEILQAHATMGFKNPDGTEVKPKVTIKYAVYDRDYETAETLKAVFLEYPQWPTTIEHDPTLTRGDDGFKIVFDGGMLLHPYEGVYNAIHSGGFVQVEGKIGWVPSGRQDARHLIIKVVPFPPKTNDKAS